MIKTILIAPVACLLALPFANSQVRSQELKTIDISDGYLFVDGQYIPPPYDVAVVNDGIDINGQVLGIEYFEPDGPRSHPRGSMGRSRHHEHREFNPLRRYSHGLSDISIGAIAVLSKGKQPLIMYRNQGGQRLLYELAGFDPLSEHVAHLSVDQQASWEQLAEQFVPNDEFSARVAAMKHESDQASIAGDRAIFASQLASKISYPLTVLAMLAVVLGFGHLLSNRPMSEHDSNDTSKSHAVIVKSLSIIALLSAVDLVWTIVATSAGTMRELNPLGSQLISDPVSLTLFKFAVTATSITILYALHRRPIAHVASWWCCLLLTLLTARWVVFQSLLA